MNCRTCPYGIDSYEEYKEIMSLDEIDDHIWCLKVGGKTSQCGYCSENHEEFNEIKRCNLHYSNKKQRMNKRERDKKHQNHLKHLYEIAGGYYPTPVRYTDEIWIKGVGHIENPKPYYQRLYRSKLSSYFKKQANRKIRRYKGELHKGYHHAHKLYDFWWNYC